MLLSSARSSVVAAGLGRRAASGIALKYANAAYAAALAKSPATLTKVQTELNAISKSITEVPDLKFFVSNPTLSQNERTQGLPALFAKAEGTGAKKEAVSEVTKNLFALLSENGRLTEAEGVIEGFNELVAKYKGELNVTVTSATPLPRDVLTKLESTLKQSKTAQEAKTLKVTNKVNPSVLGGLVVDFGEKTVDLSVSSRISKLNNLLQQSV
ncbi:ATPase F1 complex OSCP/delta subunit [Stereum hirsutum FP-91666 SS1]|uniref:ATPase F1 complex OSCP/delta subunit n=1 Tax=Stereum hirsutum (strain FP-91666) TaxID=721885 RepID=UPI000444A052|nr:ATPase F1 complex OSCP/delta subunit [Stereum hirsutum FP-91666 SS1]EIM81123.1 ATPase F1 complex OSCP/delta subunit [Stereum hirsutum FP-91666 SS1]